MLGFFLSMEKMLAVAKKYKAYMAHGWSSLSALLGTGKNKSLTWDLYPSVWVLKPVSYEAYFFPFCKLIETIKSIW